MASRQGLHRLQKGITRKLTKSELSRGYLFVTNDKEIKELQGLTIKINGREVSDRLDGSGRITAGKKLYLNASKQKAHYKLENNTIEITIE